MNTFLHHIYSLTTIRPTSAGVWLLSILMLTAVQRVMADNTAAYENWDKYGQSANISTTDADDLDIYLDNSNKTYTVRTARGLAWIASTTNNKTIYNQTKAPYAPGKKGFEDCTVVLENDIDLSGDASVITDTSWQPIGLGGTYPEPVAFFGTFDAQGKKISGMHITSATTPYIGLFGSASGIIQNLVVEGEIKVDYKIKKEVVMAGGIAGFLLNGIIRNCISKVAIDFKHIYTIDLGGIAGRCEVSKTKPGYSDSKNCTISNCYSTADVKCTGGIGGYSRIGGIAGLAYIPVSGCYSISTVTVEMAEGGDPDFFYAGGIIGDCAATPLISNCFALNKGGIIAALKCRIIGKEKNTAVLSGNYAGTCLPGTRGNKVSYGPDGANVFSFNASATLTAWAAQSGAYTPSDSYLPKLKMVNADGSTYGARLPGQPDYPSGAYFRNPADWAEYSEAADVGTSGTDVSVENGPSSKPTKYTLKTAKGLAWIAWVTNETLTYKESTPEGIFFPNDQHFKNCTVQVAESISLSKPQANVEAGFDANWIPIGIGNWTRYGKLINTFRGTFDGNGKTISGMTIMPQGYTDYLYAGLFGWIPEGVLSNVKVTGDIKLSAQDAISVGGIIGKASPSVTFSNCISEVNVEVASTGQGKNVFAGGILGEISGASTGIKNCSSSGTISATGTDGIVCAGGISGGTETNFMNNGYISYCYSSSNVKAGGNSSNSNVYAGGIVGCFYRYTSHCLALKASVTSSKTTGRVVGKSVMTLDEVYASTLIEGNWTNKFSTNKDGADFYQEDDIETLFGSGNGWAYSDGNLPTLTAFATQPTLAKKDYLDTRSNIPLTLPSDGSTDIITLKANDGKWTYQIGNGKETPFNGTISKGLNSEKESKNQLFVESTTGTVPATLTLDNIIINKTDATPVIKLAEGTTVDLRVNNICKLVNTGSNTIENNGNLTAANNENSALIVSGKTSPVIHNAKETQSGTGWLEWGISTNATYSISKEDKEQVKTYIPGQVFAIIATEGDYTIKNGDKMQKACNAEGTPCTTFTSETGKIVAYTNLSDYTPVTISSGQNITYNATHKDQLVLVKEGGVFNVGTDNASLYSLVVEPGGQVKNTKPLKVHHDFATSRIVNNRWNTIAVPVGMSISVENTVLYTASGFLETATEKQLWEDISGTSGVVSADLDTDNPYLVASEEANTTASIKATGATIPAAQQTTLGKPLDNGIFLFTANNTLQRQTLDNIYLLNSEKNCFELKTVSVVVEPLEAFVVANAVTRAAIRSLAISKGLPTGNEQPEISPDTRIWGTNGLLHISTDIPADIRIISPAGRLLRHIKAGTGDTQVSMPSGIYFIHCNNITYKIKL